MKKLGRYISLEVLVALHMTLDSCDRCGDTTCGFDVKDGFGNIHHLCGKCVRSG